MADRSRAAATIYEGTRIPSPIPTVLEVRDDLRSSEDVLHGQLRAEPSVDARRAAARRRPARRGGRRARRGDRLPAHRLREEHGAEDAGGRRSRTPARIDYLSFQNNELVFVLAVEKLLGHRGAAASATWMRMLLARAEPDPLASRVARDGGARARGDLDVLVLLPRARPHPRSLRAGRRHADAHALLPGRRARRGRPAAASGTSARKFVEVMPKAVDDYEALVDRERDLARAHAGDRAAVGRRRDRARAVRAGAARLGRRLGSPRARSRTSPTTRSTSSVPVYQEGDVYARYRVRMEEMRESVEDRRPVRSTAGCRAAPWIADDRKVVLPPREELHTSMESLIHHFKIVTEGYRVPEGEVYVDDRVAARRARLLRRLRRRAEAVAREVPRAVVRRARGDRDVHARRADRRHDRDRRLARHRHGRGRPVSTLLRRGPGDQGAVSRTRRSATLPALRLAQEQLRLALAGRVARVRRRARHHAGVLRGGRVLLRHAPPRADRPAHGRGLHERLVRARRRAAGARSASSRSSASAPGETTEDGEVTLRPIECLGGCGWATVVSVDHHYRTHVKPDDVPAIVQELRSGE